MCGITGLVHPAATRSQASSLVSRMNDAVAHRGPDDVGLALLTSNGRSFGALGHRRLAILDLTAAGHQPMTSEDGRYTIVFNGEIYNFRSLRSRLGHQVRFVSESDTEVILAGFALHGPEFLRELRGMFALAIWDCRQRRLLLARDRFGIKPLYYRPSSAGFAFASELRALLALDAAAPRLDAVGVASFLATGSVSEPSTAIAGVHMLPAGTTLELSLGDPDLTVGEPRSFAMPLAQPDVEPVRDHASAASLLRQALENSVRHHLVSDVPVGVFLSGGIDSSILAALAARLHSSSVDAFTVTFAEARFDESGPAGEVARRCGLRQHRIPLSSDGLLAALPHAFGAMDQPSLDGLNTFVISGGVRRHGYKVVLSGLGGDELFAGYPSFRRARQLARLAPSIRRLAGSCVSLWPRTHRAEKLALLFAGGEPARDAYVASRTLLPPNVRRTMLSAEPPALPSPPDGLTVLQAASWYELSDYMRNTLLRDSDVFSMAHGLELRVPFVDAEVAAASLRVADDLKLAGHQAKAILVHAFQDLLPRSVWDRPKQGFTLPFEDWMRGPLGREVEAALLDRQRVERLGLQPHAVRATWNGFRNRRGIGWSRPWSLYVLLRWAEQIGAYGPGPGRPDAFPIMHEALPSPA